MTTSRRCVLLATCTVLIGCQPAVPEFTETDAQAVRALFDSVIVDLRAGDWETWTTRYSDDARFHAPNAPAVVGHEGLLAMGRSLPPTDTIAFSNIEVWGDGNLAYGTSAIVIQFRGMPIDTQKQLAVFRRDSAGVWNVQAVSINSDLPPMQP